MGQPVAGSGISPWVVLASACYVRVYVYTVWRFSSSVNKVDVPLALRPRRIWACWWSSLCFTTRRAAQATAVGWPGGGRTRLDVYLQQERLTIQNQPCNHGSVWLEMAGSQALAAWSEYGK